MEQITRFPEFVRRMTQGLPLTSVFKNTKGNTVPVVEFQTEVESVEELLKNKYRKNSENLKKERLTKEEQKNFFLQAQEAEQLFSYITQYYLSIKKDPSISLKEKNAVYLSQKEVEDKALQLWRFCIARNIHHYNTSL